MKHPVAIIGGGLCGLTSAIRLAEKGHHIHLYEAAPAPGGRTRSFYDPTVNERVDNGPHLLIGAYLATRKLLESVGAGGNITWQQSLQLSLWDEQRGHFCLRPTPYLPFPLALMAALYRLPGHGTGSLLSLLRINRSMKSSSTASVKAWMEAEQVSPALQRDLIEPLCLGAMNEPMQSADRSSFASVLHEAFASHDHARLGWFNKPLSEAVIEPLRQRLESLGGSIFTGTTIRAIKQADDACLLHTGRDESGPYRNVVIALPAYARNRLLGVNEHIETHPITNVHLWFENRVPLPGSLIGGIGTRGQWYFDISTQMQSSGSHHICAVISAEKAGNREVLVQNICAELARLSGTGALHPLHSRIITEKHATVLVSAGHRRADSGMIIDASEAPLPGDFPATIEAAVLRGEAVAKSLCFQ
ncbi:MAG: FAD-dependent oxidoreductase [Mariprofundaceae bacterium]|nr:FAD-dependent oxidoreductase [Mariprofundaceae bacterium]